MQPDGTIQLWFLHKPSKSLTEKMCKLIRHKAFSSCQKQATGFLISYFISYFMFLCFWENESMQTTPEQTPENDYSLSVHFITFTALNWLLQTIFLQGSLLSAHSSHQEGRIDGHNPPLEKPPPHPNDAFANRFNTCRFCLVVSLYCDQSKWW